jgi:hypothetical protein
MNIFDGMKAYAEQYVVVDSRNFDAEELACVKSAKVVASQYGMSCCFFMKSGCQKYLPLSRDSQANIGDSVDLTKAKVLTLKRGEDDFINRLDI